MLQNTVYRFNNFLYTTSLHKDIGWIVKYAVGQVGLNMLMLFGVNWNNYWIGWVLKCANTLWSLGTFIGLKQFAGPKQEI